MLYSLINGMSRPALISLLTSVPAEVRGTVLGINISCASVGWVTSAIAGGMLAAAGDWPSLGWTVAVLSGAFLTLAIVIGEFTMAALLNRPAFGPFMQLLGANRAYEPPALAVIAFAITWGCMGLIQLVTRFSKHERAKV